MLKPAFLIFSRTPELGKVKKRLAADLGDRNALELHKLFLDDTLWRICSLIDGKFQSSIYLYLTSRVEDHLYNAYKSVNVKLQSSGDLGQRLEAATSEIFALGHPCCVIVGTDSPGLPKNFLIEAVNALKEKEIVIGGAEDGGYYLIGISNFDGYKTLFSEISWGSSTVFAETMAKVAALQVEPHLLPVWYDIDRLADFKRFMDDISKERIEVTTTLKQEIEKYF